MKDKIWQESGVMEKQIIAEENTPQNQPIQEISLKKPTKSRFKIILARISSKLYLAKNRKVQIALALLLVIGLIFTAFLASSKKGPIPAEQTSVKITIASPAPVSDSHLEEAKKEVTVFTGNLSSLDSELDTIK